MSLAEKINHFMMTRPVGQFVHVSDIIQATDISPSELDHLIFGRPTIAQRELSPTIMIGQRGGYRGMTRVEG